MPDDTPHRIDVHAHYLPPVYLEVLKDAGMTAIGGPPTPDWSPDAALGFMNAHGIAAQILSISDPGVSFLPAADRPALASACNDYGAQLTSAHQNRFGALAVLPMPDLDAARVELVRALDELKLDGLCLLSSYDGIYLGDPRFDPLITELESRNAWVFVHPATIPDTDKPQLAIPGFVAEYPFDTTRAFLSLLFNGTFERHPGIRWQFAHGGGTIAMLGPRIAPLAARAKQIGAFIGLPAGSKSLDANSPTKALHRSYFDTALIGDPAPLAAISTAAGADRLLFGSDWPFAANTYPNPGDPQPSLSDAFTPEQRHAIDHDTAAQQFPRLRLSRPT
jgi:predicted TIM-barrel fold metal-dependent hydrolase